MKKHSSLGGTVRGSQGSAQADPRGSLGQGPFELKRSVLATSLALMTLAAQGQTAVPPAASASAPIAQAREDKPEEQLDQLSKSILAGAQQAGFF